MTFTVIYYLALMLPEEMYIQVQSCLSCSLSGWEYTFK